MKTECSLERLRTDFDWAEVFKGEYATPVIFSDVSKNVFTISDVDEVISSIDGENDISDWIMVGKLKDGRYFKIRAGCDYTGWGCREDGNSTVAGSLEEIIRLGCTEEERERLELHLI